MNIKNISEKVKGFFVSSLPRFFKTSLPAYFKNNFEITSTKTSKIIGIVLGLAALLLVVLRITAFDALDTSVRWLLMALDLFLPFVIAAVTVFTLKIKHELTRKILGLVLLPLMPFAALTVTECLNNVFIFNMTSLGVLGNYAVLLVLYFLVFAVTGRFNITYIS